MKRLDTVLVVVAPILHLCFCCAIRFNMIGVQGSWGWMYAVALDFPASLMFLPMQVSQQFPAANEFQAPPAIQPESSFLPSLLLFALVVCLGIMAYQYFAR